MPSFDGPDRSKNQPAKAVAVGERLDSVPVAPRTSMAVLPPSPPIPTSNRRTETAALKAGIPHGEVGHLNLCVRDQESEYTGFGAHNRLVVMGEPDGSMVSVREDYKWNLPESTEEQRRKILNSGYRQHPKGTHLEFVNSEEPWDNGHWTSVTHNYRVVKDRPTAVWSRRASQ
jgi:hypothetical protein